MHSEKFISQHWSTYMIADQHHSTALPLRVQPIRWGDRGDGGDGGDRGDGTMEQIEQCSDNFYAHGAVVVTNAVADNS